VARWIQKVVLIGGIAVVGATGYGCSSAATPGPASSPAQPTAAASAGAPTSSTAPAPSAASPSTAGASPTSPGGAAGDPQPAARKIYKCSELVSDTEMRSASGYAEAKSSGDDQTGELSGQTYCQFFTGSAGISITVNVFTAGQGWDQAFLPLWKLGQVTPGAVHLDGLGDGALYGPVNHIGLALVAGHGLSVLFSDMASGKLKGADLQDQITKILKIVAPRV
jgi:hypothetical protein